jgi:hypothetical protein
MGPILEKISNWWKPKPAPTPTPTPAPIPVPEPPPKPTPTLDITPATPSKIQAVNYIRALLILKQIPFKKLREEFLKLPLKQIAYTIGVVIWFIMTYSFITRLFGM